MAEISAPRAGDTSILNSLAFRGFVYQVLLAAGVAIAGWYLYANVHENLARQGIVTGFDFLWQSAGFEIGESLISFERSQFYSRILLAGLLNTLHVSAVGIVLATILGVTVGVARVSTNWLIAKLASIYVEVFRNVPILLQIIFWASVVRNLPSQRQPISFFDSIFLSNRGLHFPVPVDHPIYPWVIGAFLIAVAGAFYYKRRARLHREATGRQLPVLWPSLALIMGLPGIIWLFAGAPLEWQVPVLRGFNYRGGMSSSPEFVAVLIGLVVYTAAFIAEIVRSGIQSVGIGQVEAARSLGLRGGLVMRLVVLPQALRVIVPPTTSQYLSLIKNSSLAVAIGYPDLVSVGNTTINQTGQAVEGIAIMMLIYLIISLTISAFMNVYNRIVAIQER
ncbi:MAG: amino acid ABC transporter permease [Acetobacterales bacterium]